MIAGKFNRETVILRRVSEQEDDYGTQEVDWEPVTTVFAEVKDVLPSRSEDVAEGVVIGRRPCRVRMHYRDGLSSTMRLQVKAVPAASLPARDLRIISGPAEIGFREGIEFMAEDITTEGQEP